MVWCKTAVSPGLSLDILKMESWTHMGGTANIIIKDVIHIFASISKIMRILLMGRRNGERWSPYFSVALSHRYVMQHNTKLSCDQPQAISSANYWFSTNLLFDFCGTIRNKLQWIVNQNTAKIMIQEMHLKMFSVKYWSFCPAINVWTLLILILEIEYSGFGDQYHACWCPGSWSHQDINRHGIDIIR